jgi:hypothetical protein
MKSYGLLLGCVIALGALGLGASNAYSQDKAGAPATVQVHMVITDEAVRDNATGWFQSAAELEESCAWASSR